MAGNLITVTDAGRAALVGPGNAGTAARRIVEIGLATAAFTADRAMKALPNERKRITTFAGENVAADTIHVTLKDDTDDQFTLYGFGLYLDNGVLAALYGQATPIMEKSTAAMLLLSADLQFTTIDAAQLVFGDATFTNPPATTVRQGVVELATSDETIAGTDTQRAVTPAGLTAAIAPAIAGKSDKGHKHAIADVDGLPAALDGKSPVGHKHVIADVTGLQGALDARLGLGGGDITGDVRLKLTGKYSPRFLLDANGYAPSLRSNSLAKALEALNAAGTDINATLDDSGVLTLPRARPVWAGYTPWDSGNLKPYTKAGGELDGNAAFQTRTAYGKTAYQVLAPDGTGMGGSYVDWNGTRTPALQIDAPSFAAVYMGLRWTRQGGRNFAAIDAWEGGSATSAPRIDFHLDGQMNAWAFGRADITRGAGGTVYGTWNFNPDTKLNTTDPTVTGRLQVIRDKGYGEIGLRSTDGTWQYMRGRGSAGGMEWVNHAYNSVIANTDDAGSFWMANLYARGQVQAAGAVVSGNGGGQLGGDGNVYGNIWGGWISNWLNNQFNNRVSIRNWNGNRGYVFTDSGNSLTFNWEGQIRGYVDGQNQGLLTTDANFSSHSANCISANQLGSYAITNTPNGQFGGLYSGGSIGLAGGTWQCMNSVQTSGGFWVTLFFRKG